MNREILFRGKRKDNGEWIEGFYLTGFERIPRNKLVHYISANASTIDSSLADDVTMHIPIIPSTVGQYTGLTDKNEVRVFEGDVLSDGKAKYLVEYSSYSTGLHAKRLGGEIWSLYHLCNNHNQGRAIEVIGNIRDNPELIAT